MSISRREFIQLLTLGTGGLWLASCRGGPPPPPPETSSSQPPSSGASSSAGTILNSMAGFDAFMDTLKLRQDGRYVYVESTGMPAHPMMIGIRSWQQQVPLPQDYNGNNAWSLPRQPILSDNPISAKTSLYRGAIALAVNGVPIFNALNNRGDDAYLAGELDQWGGHSGRADDYHYHVAPLHLQEFVGQNQPIGYALDGFPIYGSTEQDGSTVSNLDQFNGHLDESGGYHYHATQTYPYINGGMRGVIEGVNQDQVEPQPRTTPIRPFLQPLQGATITDFTVDRNRYSLEYEIDGQKYYVNYRIEGSSYIFEFVDTSGTKTTETYTRS